jgi:hypothetical protein
MAVETVLSRVDHRRRTNRETLAEALSLEQQIAEQIRLSLARESGEFALKHIGAEIIHPERLDTIRKILETKSVIWYSNHHGKADAIPQIDAISQVIPLNKLVAVVGMKQMDDRGPLQKVQGTLFNVWADAYGARIIPLITDGDKRYSEEEKAEFNRKSLDAIREILSVPGNVLLLNPEGTRSHNEQMLEGKRGLELILLRNKDTAVAVPVSSEYHLIYPFGPKTRIIPGEPVTYEELKARRKLYPDLTITELMMTDLANLINPRNWGFYKKIFDKHPKLAYPDPIAI